MGSFLEDYVNLENKFNRVNSELSQIKKEAVQLANDMKEIQDQNSLFKRFLMSKGYDPDELLKEYEAQKSKKQPIRDEVSKRNG